MLGVNLWLINWRSTSKRLPPIRTLRSVYHLKNKTSSLIFKVVVHTGKGPYFCSGGSLAEIVAGARSPRGVQRLIKEENEKIFNVFIQFPKPIIAAVNGPGIGGGVTAPALCDVTIASDKATFLTPFEQLGVKPEGCSTVHFERWHNYNSLHF